MIVLSIVCAGCLVQGGADSTRDSTRAQAPFRTTSQFSLSGARLRALPVDDPMPALVLVPGVVLRGGEVGIDQLPRLSIRGAPAGEAAVYVDGAPVRFQLLGTTGIPLATDAVGEVTVTTGLANAALPDARGGVIDYVTRGGGERFASSFHAGTDEAFGSGSSIGYNHFAAFLGGPLRAVPGLTWAISATAQGQGSPYRGKGIADQPAFVLNGVDTTIGPASLPRFAQSTGLSRPLDWRTMIRGHAKFGYRYGDGSSVSLTLLAGGVQQRFFPGQNIGDPGLYSGMHEWSRLGVADWRHPLRGGSLVVSANLSLGTDRLVEGPLAAASELDTRDPALGIEWGALGFTGSEIMPFPITDQIIRNIRSNFGLRTPYLNQTSLRNAQPYRTNPFGVATGWPTQGLDATLTLASERRLDGRWAIDWSPGTMHRLSVGADFTRTDLSYYSSGLLSELNLDAYRVQPRRVGAFATDRIEFSRVTAEVGVRYDRFDPNGLFPKFLGRIFTNPAWNGNSATSDTAYAGSVARVYAGTATKSVLSPQASAAVHVAPGVSLRAGVGQHAVPPSLGKLFALSNSDAANTQLFGPTFGRDVRYAKSTTLEIGGRYGRGAVSVDVAVHHETALDPYEPRLISYDDPANPGRTIVLVALTQSGGSHGTGADLALEWQHGTTVDAAAAYSYLHTTHEGQHAVSTHAVGARVDWRPWSGWSVTVFARAASGLPYTRLENFGLGILASQEPGLTFLSGVEPLNASQLPWTKAIDLRIAKGVRTVGRDWTVFADFRNLLGFKNSIDAYAETGSGVNDVYRQSLLNSEYGSLQIEANANGALLSGNTVDLRNCAGWATPINCVALARVERRFGDGDGLYTLAEQDRALNTYFDSFAGAWRFHGSGRTVRVGMELRL